jgi:hypothetical protein
LNIIPVFLELEERKWRERAETIVGAQRRLRRTGRVKIRMSHGYCKVVAELVQ